MISVQRRRDNGGTAQHVLTVRGLTRFVEVAELLATESAADAVRHTRRSAALRVG